MNNEISRKTIIIGMCKTTMLDIVEITVLMLKRLIVIRSLIYVCMYQKKYINTYLIKIGKYTKKIVMTLSLMTNYSSEKVYPRQALKIDYFCHLALTESLLFPLRQSCYYLPLHRICNPMLPTIRISNPQFTNSYNFHNINIHHIIVPSSNSPQS